MSEPTPRTEPRNKVAPVALAMGVAALVAAVFGPPLTVAVGVAVLAGAFGCWALVRAVRLDDAVGRSVASVVFAVLSLLVAVLVAVSNRGGPQ